jgi:signal transduction histidine kinase/tetratricopeptide (TPR) repeat protein
MRFAITAFLIILPVFVYSIDPNDPPLGSTGLRNGVIDSLDKIDRTKLDNVNLLHLYNDYINAYRHLDPYRGYQYGDTALNIHDDFPVGIQHQSTYNRIANLFFDQGFYFTATKYYKKALDVAIELEDYGAIAYSLNDIGYAHRKTNNFVKSLEYYGEAVEAVINIPRHKDVLAHTYTNISTSNGMLGDFKKSLDYAEKAADIYLELGNMRDYYRALSYTSLSYLKTDQPGKAIQTMKKVLDEYEYNDYQDSFFLSSMLRFTSVTFKDAGSNDSEMLNEPYIDSAIYYGRLGLEVSKNVNYNLERIITHESLAKAFLIKSDTLAALHHFERMLDISREFGYINYMVNALEGMLFFKQFLSDEKKLELYDEFYSSKQQILEELVNDRIKSYDYEIDLAKQDANIEILEAESRAKTNLFYGSLVAVFFLVILIMTFLFFYKRRRELIKELEILNSDLQDSFAAQKQLNATKDKFFSIIAHDLKNPFSAFKQSLEMLSENYEEFTKKEIQAFLYELRLSSFNLKKLLDDLLTWSQSQRGTIPYNPSINRFDDIVKYTMDTLKGQADQKNISIHSNVPDNSQIYCDAGMMSTAIRNLISNAIKYTPDNGRVSIYFDAIEDQYTISIKDTGIGISKDRIENLFTVGNNKSTPGTRQEHGTGLGLVLVREFIERHGGTIEVESEEGKGTTFIITIPIGTESSPDFEAETENTLVV